MLTCYVFPLSHCPLSGVCQIQPANIQVFIFQLDVMRLEISSKHMFVFKLKNLNCLKQLRFFRVQSMETICFHTLHSVCL